MTLQSLGPVPAQGRVDFFKKADGSVYVRDATGNITYLGTETLDPTAFATAAQGAEADSAVQPGDLAAIATTGASADASYDNTSSGLTGTNVQDAIDELAAFTIADHFPTSPVVGQIVSRSDIGYEFFFWDGTYWLTCVLHESPPDTADGASSTASYTSGLAIGRWSNTHDVGIHIEAVQVTTYQTSAGSGSNKLTFQLSKRTSSNTSTDIGSALSTSSDSANVWTRHYTSMTEYVPSATIFELQLNVTFTGSPFAYMLPRIFYRKVYT